MLLRCDGFILCAAVLQETYVHSNAYATATKPEGKLAKLTLRRNWFLQRAQDNPPPLWLLWIGDYFCLTGVPDGFRITVSLMKVYA